MFSFWSAWMRHFISVGQWGIKNSKVMTFLKKQRMVKGGRELNCLSLNKSSSSALHGRRGVTNDGRDSTPLTSLSIQICSDYIQQGWQEASVPLPAGFSMSADASPAPVLAPWEAFAAPSVPAGSSLYKGQSAPAAQGWMTATHPRYHSSAGR